MTYEVYDRSCEGKFIVRNVEEVIETRYDFKFKYNNGSYSREYSKRSCDYQKYWRDIS